MSLIARGDEYFGGYLLSIFCLLRTLYSGLRSISECIICFVLFFNFCFLKSLEILDSNLSDVQLAKIFVYVLGLLFTGLIVS